MEKQKEIVNVAQHQQKPVTRSRLKTKKDFGLSQDIFIQVYLSLRLYLSPSIISFFLCFAISFLYFFVFAISFLSFFVQLNFSFIHSFVLFFPFFLFLSLVFAQPLFPYYDHIVCFFFLPVFCSFFLLRENYLQCTLIFLFIVTVNL